MLAKAQMKTLRLTLTINPSALIHGVRLFLFVGGAILLTTPRAYIEKLASPQPSTAVREAHRPSIKTTRQHGPTTIKECADFDVEYFDNVFSLKVEYPKRVTIGDASLVKAMLSIESRSFNVVNPYPMCKGDNLSRPATSEEAKLERRRIFESIEGLDLELAEVDVKPSGINRMIDGTATWSVSPSKPGSLNGVIRVMPEPPDSATRDDDYQRSYEGLAGYFPTILELQAYENPFAATSALSWIPKVLGTLLTIPGIILFYREFKERRQKAQEAKKEKQNIILP